MAQPLAQQEGYKLEVRLTKIRVNQEGPVYGNAEHRHSYAKDEKIYCVPTRRNLAARQLHEGFLPIDPVCRRTKSSHQKELVRLVAQNHERNNVAVRPSRKDM